MKYHLKQHLSFLILATSILSPSWAFANIAAEQDENINFADPEVKRICVANWDTNGDGELSRSEAAAVQDLGDVFSANMSISSFDELQYFTGLTRIGESAFYYCFGLSSVVIPENVTSIGEYAFNACGSLRSITIPARVTSIGHVAFQNCMMLADIAVEAGNATYDSRENCNAIIETATNTLIAGGWKTVIPESVTAIGDYAFWGSTYLSSVTLPKHLTRIGDGAFGSCSITNLVIPDEVTSIGMYAFSSCTSLTSITIPKNVTTLGFGVFQACYGLTSLKVAPENPVYDSREECNAIIETATNTLIEGCQTSFVPESVTAIGPRAFMHCHFTSFTIPKNVTYIGYGAFQRCKNIESIYSYIRTPFDIGSDVFEGVPATSILYVPNKTKALYQATNGWKDFPGTITEMNPQEDTSERIAFADPEVKRICVTNWDIDDDGELSMDEAAEVKDLGQLFKENKVITSFDELQYFTSLTSIGVFAFSRCENLKSIILPKGVASIGDMAFEYCYALQSIVIPEGVTSIGPDAFFRSGISSVSIPNTVTSIGWSAFRECGLTSVTIPESVQSIDQEAFQGCYFLLNVISEIKTPFSIPSNVFQGIATNASLLVPNGTTAAYTATEGWKDFPGQIKVFNPDFILFADNQAKHVCVANWDANGDGELSYAEAAAVQDIGQAFRGNLNLHSFDELQYFTSLTSLADSAFYYTDCVSIKIPASVKSIGVATFSCCGLTTLEIPENVTSIGERAFEYTGITSVKLPSSLTAINATTFRWSKQLKSIVIPENVTSIGAEAFYGCESLESVIFPDKLETIESQAFMSCNKLTSIRIPKNMNTIGEDAFAYCELLDTIYFDCTEIKAWESAWKRDAYWSVVIKEAVIGENVMRIGDHAFWDWANLASIHITEHVTSIGEAAFASCPALASVTIDEGVTDIGSGAFSECTSLTAVQLPQSVTAIGPAAFFGCSNLASVNIPTNVTAINNSTFYGCSSLTAITIPASVTAFGEDVFVGCDTLTTVILQCPVIGVRWFQNLPSIQEVVFEEGVTTVCTNAFDNCTGITSLHIPASMTSVEQYAFMGCSGIQSIQVAAGNTVYDSREDCNAMIEKSSNMLFLGSGSTVIPESVKGIGFRAFANCLTLTSIVIPDIAYFYIDEAAFEGCTNLTSITSYIKAPESTYPNVFSGVPNTCILYVPYGCKSIYESTEGWNYFPGTIVEMEDPDAVNFADATVREICVSYWDADGDGKLSYDEAAMVSTIGTQFTGNSQISSFDELQYFTGLQAIEAKAFNNCAQLRSIIIPSSVEYVGPEAFIGTKKLLSVQWNSSAELAANCFDSPAETGNLLVYVNSDAVVRYQGNVIRKGEIQSLKLRDNQPLYVPVTFKAMHVEYTREFSKPTVAGIASGWEGIVLPFNVQRIEHRASDFMLAPFNANGGADANFWLAMNENDNDNNNDNGLDFVMTTSMKANVPYIIAMPNNETYKSWQNIVGAVTFSAENADIKATVPQDEMSTGEAFSLYGAYETVSASDQAYVLNEQVYTADGKTFPSGGVFVRGGGDVLPFRAYMADRVQQSGDHGAKPRYIPIFPFEGEASDIAETLITPSLGGDGRDCVYDLSGCLIAYDLHDFLRRKSEMKRGLYLCGQQKFWLK